MSLQGSLETFALADVLALLASTHKSGELLVTHPPGTTGDPVAGRVRVDAGDLVGWEVGGATDAVQAISELLRLPGGDFAFHAGPGEPTMQPVPLEAVLEQVRQFDDEWAEITRVLPTDATLRLGRARGPDDLVLSPEQWDVVVAIAGGQSLAGVAIQLGTDQLTAGRRVRDLAASGLVEVSAAMPGVVPGFPEGLGSTSRQRRGEVSGPGAAAWSTGPRPGDAGTSAAGMTDGSASGSGAAPDRHERRPGPAPDAAGVADEGDMFADFDAFDGLVTLPSRTVSRGASAARSAVPSAVASDPPVRANPRRTLSAVLQTKAAERGEAAALGAAGPPQIGASIVPTTEEWLASVLGGTPTTEHRPTTEQRPTTEHRPTTEDEPRAEPAPDASDSRSPFFGPSAREASTPTPPVSALTAVPPMGARPTAPAAEMPVADSGGPRDDPVAERATLSDDAEGDGPLNRGLLLKFLSSVRS